MLKNVGSKFHLVLYRNKILLYRYSREIYFNNHIIKIGIVH